MPSITPEMIRELRRRVGEDGLERLRYVNSDLRIVIGYLVECGWGFGDARDLTVDVIWQMVNTGPDSVAPVRKSREIEW